MKVLKFFVAALAAMLAVSCAKESTTNGQDGDLVDVTFTAEFSGQPGTRAISDGLTVDQLVFAVYDVRKNELQELRQNDIQITSGQPTEIKTTLVKNTYYYFLFWAQKKGTGYYNTDDMKSITVTYDGKANDESRDVFYAQKGVKITDSNPINITLTRPLAQINFGTTDKEVLAKSNKSVVSSKITIEGVATTFKPFDNKFEGEESATFEIADTPDSQNEVLTVKGTTYQYLAMAYVFPRSYNTESMHNVSAEFTLDNGTTIPMSVPNTPILFNSRTNILGSLLTNTSQFTVTINNEWKNGEQNLDENARLLSILENGGDLTLPMDVTVPEGENGVVIRSGKTSTLNLNGKKFENNNTTTTNGSNVLDVRGELTIEGEGTVRCAGNHNANDQAILVQDGGKLIIKGGNYSIGADASGKGNSCIHVTYNTYTKKSGSVEIYGGTFSTDAMVGGKYLVLNQDNVISTPCFTVYGGTFINYNPADGDDNVNTGSYVAPGYESVQISTSPATWVVVKVGVKPVANQEGLTTALSEIKEMQNGSDVTVQLPTGTFTIRESSDLKGKDVNVTFAGNGPENTTFEVGTDNHTSSEANGDYSLEGTTSASFKDMTIKVDNDNYRGYIRVKELYFENCVFENRISFWGDGKVTFKNCTFNQTAEDYNLWTYSGREFIFENCTFNSVGKFMNLYKEPGHRIAYKVTVKDCTFNSTKVIKSALEFKQNDGKKYEIHFEGNNKGTNLNISSTTGSNLFNSNESETDAVVYVDGSKVWENGTKIN